MKQCGTLELDCFASLVMTIVDSFFPSPLAGEGSALRARASNKPGEGSLKRMT